jgi:hypothetical protein
MDVWEPRPASSISQASSFVAFRNDARRTAVALAPRLAEPLARRGTFARNTGCSRRRSMRVTVIVAVLVASSGCASGGGGEERYDYLHSPGAARYRELCQVCHGETGEGGLGPPLVDTRRSYDELVDTISRRMPANAPGQCTGACATDIASFITEGLTTSALACDAVPPAPRRLRQLTRREYRATVRDLLGTDAPVMACARPTDCAFRDTCAAGACEPTACDAQTFVFDPGGRTLATVHIAGEFNGWPGTIAAGGWPLEYSAATGQWSGTFSLPEGDHEYKLVLDEHDWITDPRAPATVPDGFGGQNSALSLTCAGAGVLDPVASIPIETRPAGFPFDSDADAAVVGASHVDAYLAAAEKLADSAAARVATIHPCNWDGDRDGCTRTFVATIGRRAFRRPLTGDEHDRLVGLALAAASRDEGVATAIHAMLVSPSFLYRSEVGEADGDGYRLGGYELATAISYMVIGTTPDDALLAAAEAGDLDTPTGIEAQARRLLADPRARDQIGEFALQWIGGEAVLTADKRADLFPDFDAATRASLADETRAFAAHVVFDATGTFSELLTADYTVVDPIAARFYGLPAPAGGHGVVPYGDGRRAGVLGHASTLAAHAHSDQTSPILRGLVVRRNILCEELPPPPPFAGGVPDVDPNATTRERFAQHTANPVCESCHRYIDGVGFGFEHFDPTGAWRETENGAAIDASGDMNDVEHLGTETTAPYTTLPELASIVAGSRAAQSCFARQYFRFARGKRETLADRCARLAIEARFAAAGGDVRELVIQTILAPDFAVRR